MEFRLSTTVLLLEALLLSMGGADAKREEGIPSSR